MLTLRHLRSWTVLWWGCFLLGTLAGAPVFDPETDRLIPEKAPHPWPSNRDVRLGEPGCWKPPSDRFSPRAAKRAVLPAFVAGLDATDRAFGDIPKDIHIDGFVPLRGRSTPWEVSIVRIGPHTEDEESVNKPSIRTYLLITSHGKILWRNQIAETPTGAFADHYRLSRVVTQFGRSPMVLLFCNTGGNTRDFIYTLEWVTKAGLEDIWKSSDLDDGHSGSVQQGYAWSNFDFSPLGFGRANEFTVYTTSGIRRVMYADDVKDLKPKYTRRTYRWSKRGGTFVKAAERSFSKPNPWLDKHPPIPIFRNLSGG